MKKLSLSTPYLKFSELKNVYNCIKTEWISTSGTYINLFEKKLSKYTKSNYTVLCNSGTSALDIALKLTGIKKNDEVIVPTLTFIATINCIIYNNASPIFMDSDETFNIDADPVGTTNIPFGFFGLSNPSYLSKSLSVYSSSYFAIVFSLSNYSFIFY